MEIQKVINGNELTVRLTGRLTTTTAPELEQELEASLAGITALIFDFQGLEYISSAGLRLLLGAKKAIGPEGTVTVENVNEEVNEVFEVTGFLDILESVNRS